MLINVEFAEKMERSFFYKCVMKHIIKECFF